MGFGFSRSIRILIFQFLQVVAAKCWLSALEQRREESGDGTTAGRGSDGLAKINDSNKHDEHEQNSDFEQERAESAGLQRQPARRRRRFLPRKHFDAEK